MGGDKNGQKKCRKFHELLTPEDLDYYNSLIDWAEAARPDTCYKLPSRWSEEDCWARETFAFIKRAFTDIGDRRKAARRIEDLDFDHAT